MKKIVLAAAAAVVIALTAAPSFAAPQFQSANIQSYQELPGNWGSGRHVEPGVGR